MSKLDELDKEFSDTLWQLLFNPELKLRDCREKLVEYVKVLLHKARLEEREVMEKIDCKKCCEYRKDCECKCHP